MERKELFDVVAVRGADALPFLNSQFAADLNGLGDDRMCWSALLNPQGRVLHVLAATRLAADDWRLCVPFSRGSELIEYLRQFVFRRKLALSPDDDHHVAPGETPVALMLTTDPAAAMDATHVDLFIAAGLALIDPAASGRHLAHSLRLDRFDAFSVKKGCYPGQEIVARTHFLGRNKRFPVVLDGPADPPWRSGHAVRDGDTDIGEVVCAGRASALAVLTRPVAAGHVLTIGDDHRPVQVHRCLASES